MWSQLWPSARTAQPLPAAVGMARSSRGTCRAVQSVDGHMDRVLGLASGADGRSLASGSWDRTVERWEVASGRLLQTLSGHRDKVHCVAWSPDGRAVASGGVDKAIWLYDVVQGYSQVALRGHSAAVYSLAFTSDSVSLLS